MIKKYNDIKRFNFSIQIAQLMRNYFFERGQEVKIYGRSYIIAPHRLDSHIYALERIQNASQNSTTHCFSQLDHKYFLRYYTCWQQIEQVVVKLESIEQQIKKQSKQAKVAKKKSLIAFLSKKKSEVQQKNEHMDKSVSIKQKNQNKVQYKQEKVFYVQLESFTSVSIPKNISNIKQLLAIIYLLAETVKKDLGFYPELLPVLNGQEHYRFIRKGESLHLEIMKSVQYFMKDKDMKEWSVELANSYQKYKNAEFTELSLCRQEFVNIVLKDIFEYVKRDFSILVKVDGVYQPDICQIQENGDIQIINVGYELMIKQYNITILHQDQKMVKVILDHLIFSPIVLSICSENCRFLIQYLQQLAT